MPPEWIPWPATARALPSRCSSAASRTARIGRAFRQQHHHFPRDRSPSWSARARWPRIPWPACASRAGTSCFVMIVGSLMIPNAVVLVPQYVLAQRLGWLSTYQGLIVPEAAMTLRLRRLPPPAVLPHHAGRGSEDAARIDGAEHVAQSSRRSCCRSRSRCSRRWSIFAFRSAWNDFLWPLIAVQQGGDVPAAGGAGAAARRL